MLLPLQFHLIYCLSYLLEKVNATSYNDVFFNLAAVMHPGFKQNVLADSVRGDGLTTT